MNIYYMDEPLNKQELVVAKELLVDFEGLPSIQEVQQVKVAVLLPADDQDQSMRLLNDRIQANTNSFEQNLKRAGIAADIGRPVVWVAPTDGYWGAIAIRSIAQATGVYPYVVQRWSRSEQGEFIRVPIRMIDGNGMMKFA
jgi:hypothetical protein